MTNVRWLFHWFAPGVYNLWEKLHIRSWENLLWAFFKIRRHPQLQSTSLLNATDTSFFAAGHLLSFSNVCFLPKFIGAIWHPEAFLEREMRFLLKPCLIPPIVFFPFLIKLFLKEVKSIGVRTLLQLHRQILSTQPSKFRARFFPVPRCGCAGRTQSSY